MLKLLKNIFNKNKTKDLTYINKIRNITKESVKTDYKKELMDVKIKIEFEANGGHNILRVDYISGNTIRELRAMGFKVKYCNYDRGNGYKITW